MSAKKLLVADDSLTIQKVIRLALSNEGYEIQTVSDGNDALQQIAVFRPDVVLIDISLPKKNAFEVKQATETAEGPGKVRFVVMLSAFEKVDQSKIEGAAFHGKLTKPFDPAHLREVLNQVLATIPAQEEVGPSPSVRPLPPMPEEEPAADLPTFDMASLSSDKTVPDEFEPLPPLPGIPPMPEMPGLPEEIPGISLQPPEPWGQQKPTSQENEGDSDIRHLTESTIRMSGLDDFQWSVNEPATQPSPSAGVPPMRDEPTLKPSPQMMDMGSSNFGFEQPSLPPLPSLDNLDRELIQPPVYTSPMAPPHSSFAPPPPPAPAAAPISKEEIEAIIQAQVSKMLEEMAKKVLPDVAERVIKQEIHRLLSL